MTKKGRILRTLRRHYNKLAPLDLHFDFAKEMIKHWSLRYTSSSFKYCILIGHGLFYSGKNLEVWDAIDNGCGDDKSTWTDRPPTWLIKRYAKIQKISFVEAKKEWSYDYYDC